MQAAQDVESVGSELEGDTAGPLQRASFKQAMRDGFRIKRWGHTLPLLAMLLGGFPLLVPSSSAAASACGSPATTGTSHQIVHAPTLSLETVTWELTQRGSPLSVADARYLVQASQRANIDDAFALAVWATESQDGREAVPGTHNIGNITATQGVAWANHIFAIYPTWQAGMAAWFTLITQLYVRGGHATNLVTFALYYVHGLTPQDVSPQQQQEIVGGYVHNLTSIISTLQQHEAALHPGQATPASSGTGAITPSSQTLLSLLPANNLPPNWAGPGTWPAASAIHFNGTCDTPGVDAPPMVLAALQLGAFLRPNAQGAFDHWVAGTPNGVLSENGITWDTDFLASVYQRATGKAFPAYPAAAFWWNGPLSQEPGWARIPGGPNQMPQAGDIAVMLDGARGEAALIVGVGLPHSREPGFVLVLQAHAQHVLERWILQADGTLRPPWPFWTVLQGYLRPSAS